MIFELFSGTVTDFNYLGFEHGATDTDLAKVIGKLVTGYRHSFVIIVSLRTALENCARWGGGGRCL